jgi:hypothetical protein
MAMAKIGIVSSALTADLCLGPGAALADVTESVGTPAFDTYNIIPDAGVNLDPTLRKVDVSVSTRWWKDSIQCDQSSLTHSCMCTECSTPEKTG